MTVQEAINREDKLKANKIDLEQKIRWLTELDRQVYEEIVRTHETDIEEPDFLSYGLTTQLIIPDVYSNIYLTYLEMKIAITNGETKVYNRAATDYNNAYITVQDYFNRNYMPITKARIDYNHKRWL